MNADRITVLITGAAGSLGTEITKYFEEQKFNIIALDQDSEKLKALNDRFPSIKSYSCDLADYVAVEGVMSNILESQQIDLLINNAGFIHSEPLVNLLSKENNHHSFNSWSKTIDANLTSVFNTSCFIAEQMVKRRYPGVIINISSISANGNMGQSAYSAAKAGVNALTACWGKELALFGIRTVAISPGFIDTNSTSNSLSEKQLEKIKRDIPLKRMGQVKHILSTIQFVIDNDYINGKVIEVDGGLRI